MSVPPDQFDENGDEQQPESIDDEFVAWRADSEPPDWFLESGNFFGELDDRESVFLSVYGGLGAVETDELGNYSFVIRGYDEDSGEDLFWNFSSWDRETIQEFTDYIDAYYDSVAFWPDGGSGDLRQL